MMACRSEEPLPKDLPGAAVALTSAAGRIDDDQDRSIRVWTALRRDHVARDLLANNAVGLLWLSGRGFSAYRVGTWGGLLKWTSSLIGGSLLDTSLENAMTGAEPAALLRCSNTGCSIDDVEQAWEDLEVEGSCGPFYRVFGVERDAHRYAVIVGIQHGGTKDGDVHRLGIRVLHGEHDTKAFAFAPEVVADEHWPHLGRVTSRRGCAWISWRGRYDAVQPESDGRALLLRTPGGVIRLQPGVDDRLYVEPRAQVAAEPDQPALPPSPPATKPGELDAAAGKVMIGELNELCGDTWCEGKYDWTFKSLTCRDGTCTLGFSAKNTDTDKVFDDKLRFRFRARAFDGDGPTAEFYEAIAEAIASWVRSH